MNRFIISAAFVVASAAGAAAMTSATELPPGTASEVRSVVPDADLSNLTNAQIQALKLAVHSSDSTGERNSAIRSIVK